MTGMRRCQDRALHYRRTRYKPGFRVCRCRVCREANMVAEEEQRVSGTAPPAMGEPVPGCEYVNPEKVFAELWEERCRERPGINYGLGLVQDLMVVYPPHERRAPKMAFWLTPRERVIVATVVQWLGTNVGFGFLHEVLGRCGLAIVETDSRGVKPARRITPHPEEPPMGQVALAMFRGMVEDEG